MPLERNYLVKFYLRDQLFRIILKSLLNISNILHYFTKFYVITHKSKGMKYHLVVVFVTLFYSGILSQAYNTVGGLRLGDDFGLTVSQRIANKSTLDLIYQPGTFAGNEMMALAVKQHYPLITKRFNVFIGGGLAHRITHHSKDDEPYTPVQNTHLSFTLGGELTVGRLSFSIDYMPMVSISNYQNAQKFNAHSGLSMRYVFIKKPKPKQKFLQKINVFKKKKS